MRNYLRFHAISWLVLLSNAPVARGADRPYPLLADTPAYVCENLIYGDKFGSPYAGPTFDRIRTVLDWRYDVELIGLDEVLARDGGAFFVSNHSTPADPAVVLTAIGDRTALRPLVTGNLKNAPLLGRIFDATNAFLQPEPTTGGLTAVRLLEHLIAEMVNANRHGDNILFYPSGFAQTQIYDHLEAQTMVHRILALNPDARFVLVRQRGLWGSSFSHGAPVSDPEHKISTNAAIVRGLMTGARILATNGPLTPKRKVTFEFVEPADFPRRGTVAEINAYLTAFYAGGAPERRTFVKSHFLWPGPSSRVVDEDIDYGRAPQRWARNAADPSRPVDAEVRATIVDILRREFGFAESDRLAGLMDSIARVQFFLAIEARLGVRFDDDAAFGDVDDLARQVVSLRERRSAIGEAGASPWFAPAPETLDAAARRLKDRLARWPDKTVGVLRPKERTLTVLEAALHRAGKGVLFVDPDQDGKKVVRLLDEVGVKIILTTPEYLKAIADDKDLSQYLERFRMVDSLKPQG